MQRHSFGVVAYDMVHIFNVVFRGFQASEGYPYSPDTVLASFLVCSANVSHMACWYHTPRRALVDGAGARLQILEDMSSSNFKFP